MAPLKTDRESLRLGDVLSGLISETHGEQGRSAAIIGLLLLGLDRAGYDLTGTERELIQAQGKDISLQLRTALRQLEGQPARSGNVIPTYDKGMTFSAEPHREREPAPALGGLMDFMDDV